MSRQWIKLWGEKLLSSLNFRELTLAEKGTYTCLLLMARTDGPYAGALCYPNGEPYDLPSIARGISADQRIVTKHVERLMALGMVNQEPHGETTRYRLRKYDELQERPGGNVESAPRAPRPPRAAAKIPGGSPEPSGKVTGNPQAQSSGHKDLRRVGREVEEKRTTTTGASPRWNDGGHVEKLQKLWGITFRTGFLVNLQRDVGAVAFQAALTEARCSRVPSVPRDPEAYLTGIARKVARGLSGDGSRGGLQAMGDLLGKADCRPGSGGAAATGGEGGSVSTPPPRSEAANAT